jgi:predicted transcriptional regulator YdeE
MKLRLLEQKECFVIGIEARTNNTKEMSGEGVIPRQWERFYKERILDRIKDRADSSVLAFYTEYASGRKGDYTFVIGARVSKVAGVPEGLVLKKIPAGHYAVFESAKGPLNQVVPQAWMGIWEMEDKRQLGGDRVYGADFEVYDQRASDPHNAVVEIHVGVK